jgi:hypothetical protein
MNYLLSLLLLANGWNFDYIIKDAYINPYLSHVECLGGEKIGSFEDGEYKVVFCKRVGSSMIKHNRILKRHLYTEGFRNNEKLSAIETQEYLRHNVGIN